MVMAPAKTGKERSRRNAVIKILQTKSGIEYSGIPCERILKIVTIKLIAPRMEDIPAR